MPSPGLEEFGELPLLEFSEDFFADEKVVKQSLDDGSFLDILRDYDRADLPHNAYHLTSNFSDASVGREKKSRLKLAIAFFLSIAIIGIAGAASSLQHKRNGPLEFSGDPEIADEKPFPDMK